MAETLTGEESWYMDNFKLPVQDTQKVRRNFAGVEDKEYMTMAELVEGDHHDGHAGGMTETDEATSGKTDGPYTYIQEKTMGQKSRWPYKQSADGKRYNTEKSTGFGKLVF
jgi:hypothetical protein